MADDRSFSRPSSAQFALGDSRGPGGGRRPVAATSWRNGIPAAAAEHRGSLADAEADAAFRWIAPALEGRDALIVGCGAGHGAGILLDAGGASVIGVDPDPVAIEIATRLHGERASFTCSELHALPFAPRSFDVVLCLEALEQTAVVEEMLAGLRRLLRAEGLLVASLPTRPRRDPIDGTPLADNPGAAGWQAKLSESFANVRAYRRRVCLGAAVLAAEIEEDRIDSVGWLGADPAEEHSALLLASDGALPEPETTATLVGGRDLRAYRETVAAWEQRARRAEADGAAKHWELVASREAQRRLRKRLWHFENSLPRRLFRLLRGRPARIGEGPPIRPPERKGEPWL
jgi:SAM-dependent methyltransferase